jgi:hypothetical protein
MFLVCPFNYTKLEWTSKLTSLVSTFALFYIHIGITRSVTKAKTISLPINFYPPWQSDFYLHYNQIYFPFIDLPTT